MSINDAGDRTMRSTHTRAILIGGAVPVAIALAGAILMLTWLPDLPYPIAVHWNGAGADGFGPALPFIFTPLAIAVLFSIFVVAASWRTSPSGGLLYNQKLVLVTSVWLSVMLSVGFVGSIAVQRGLADAKNAPDIGWLLAIGAGIGLVLAAGGWFALPAGESSITELGEQPKAVTVSGDERLSWSHTARLGNAALVIVGIALAIAVGVAIITLTLSQPSALLAAIVLVFVMVLVATTTWWRVTADRRGFIVRGAMGWPSKHVPLSDIRTVQVVQVTPTRDFGGYGWRWAVDGRSGVILRAGPAIEVTAASGKRFVVTVDDAETGAGVIAALLSHEASRAG